MNAAPAGRLTSGVSREQIAHDLAMAYIHNRYAAEVEGGFEVESSRYDDTLYEVTGSGEVWTKNLPPVSKIRMDDVEVKTGQRGFFGLGAEKTRTVQVESGQYEVDPIFRNMINDYYEAYSRFLQLLETR